MRRSLLAFELTVMSLTFLLFFVLSLFPIPSSGESSSPMQIAFLFWHRRSSPVNTSEYDPKFPDRYEYLQLEEWAPNGWAPKKIDVVLQADTVGRAKLQGVSTLRVTVSLRVGPLKLDPKEGLTDFKALEANAVWLPAQLSKTMPRGRVPKTNQVVLLKDFNLEEMYTGLWKQGLWPLELKVEVLLEPLRPEHLHEAVISRTLRLIPGD